MTQLTEDRAPATPTMAATDLPTAIQQVLADSPEPLTPAKIRDGLPSSVRPGSVDELVEQLRRLAAAGVVRQYPKYRSAQDRYWDRPMPVHIASLLRGALQEEPLALSELRRKLPAYAVNDAETVLREQVEQGRLHRHPPATKRGGERFGVRPPDPKEYLQDELSGVFRRLEQLGFTRARLRAGALEILHDEEWAPTVPAEKPEPQHIAAAEETRPHATEFRDPSQTTQRGETP